MKPIRETIHFDKKLIDKDAQKVVKTLNKAGHEAYLVGGCIRDYYWATNPKTLTSLPVPHRNRFVKLSNAPDLLEGASD